MVSAQFMTTPVSCALDLGLRCSSVHRWRAGAALEAYMIHFLYQHDAREHFHIVNVYS